MTAKKVARPAKKAPAKVTVGTPNDPAYTTRLDAAKHEAMKRLVLKALPATAPGLTQSELFAKVGAARDATVFPGTTHTWWAKMVQLDLESKGALSREPTKPLRWHRAR